MTTTIVQALDDAAAAVADLDARCCEPGRSPRMAELSGALDAIRASVPEATGAPLDSAALDRVLTAIESAGGMVGALQVGCCAPNRLPLYARVLERLTTVQIELTQG